MIRITAKPGNRLDTIATSATKSALAGAESDIDTPNTAGAWSTSETEAPTEHEHNPIPATDRSAYGKCACGEVVIMPNEVNWTYGRVTMVSEGIGEHKRTARQHKRLNKTWVLITPSKGWRPATTEEARTFEANPVPAESYTDYTATGFYGCCGLPKNQGAHSNYCTRQEWVNGHVTMVTQGHEFERTARRSRLDGRTEVLITPSKGYRAATVKEAWTFCLPGHTEPEGRCTVMNGSYRCERAPHSDGDHTGVIRAVRYWFADRYADVVFNR